MNEGRADVLRRELAASDMLAKVFLDLPTREDMERIVALDPRDLEGSASGDMLARFVRESRERSPDDTLLDVARERVAFVRGTVGCAVDPPYESLYIQSPRSEVLLSLAKLYAECEVHKTEDIREAADHIGVEFAFLVTLLRRELELIDIGRFEQADAVDAAIERFEAEHLFRWSGAYARKIGNHARSPYWKAVGLSILEVAAIRER